MARLQKYKENRRKPRFILDKTRLIRFREIVYLPKKVKRKFVKEIYKELLIRHLKINKTREAVAACYYFPFISKIAKKVVKECDICNKSRLTMHKLYKLLISLLTPKEL
jgi:hypothetical protein